MSGVGCEIIATHNALRLSGNSSELCSVIRSFETNGYLMANGYLGSDPYAIGEYLSAKSVSYTEYPDNDTSKLLNSSSRVSLRGPFSSATYISLVPFS